MIGLGKIINLEDRKIQDFQGKTYIISDVHLKREDRRKFILSEFIESLDGNLILLGDIFDIWIGRNKDNEKSFSCIIEAIQKVILKGKKVFYVEGNHDFHLVWLDDMGIGRAHELILKSGNKLFFLSHGDMYSGEITHLTYRRFILKTEGIFKIISNGYFERTINSIGEVLSSLSHRKNLLPRARGKRMKLFLDMLRNGVEISQRLGVHGVIFGHCHIPVVLNMDDKIYANSGFWGHKYGTYIEIDEGELKVKKIDFVV